MFTPAQIQQLRALSVVAEQHSSVRIRYTSTELRLTTELGDAIGAEEGTAVLYGFGLFGLVMTLILAYSGAWLGAGINLLLLGAGAALGRQLRKDAQPTLQRPPDVVLDAARRELRVSTVVSGAPRARALNYPFTVVTGLRLVALPPLYHSGATIGHARLDAATRGTYRPLLRVERYTVARQLAAMLGQLLAVPVEDTLHP